MWISNVEVVERLNRKNFRIFGGEDVWGNSR